MDETRIKEVFSDEAFVMSLLEIEEPEAVRAAIKEKGIEMSLEEITGLGAMLVDALEKAAENGGELALEELDEAAGGWWVATMLIHTAKTAAPYIVAAAATSAVATSAILRRW